MFSMKLCRNNSCSVLIRDIRRGISRTSTYQNSYAISRAQGNKLQHTSLEFNGKQNVNVSWMKQMQHSNTRALSTTQQTLTKSTPFISLASNEQSKKFMAVFPDIVKELTEDESSQELPDVMRRFSEVLHYNAPTEKVICGTILTSMYQLLEDPKNLTAENIKAVNTLGWCNELVQVFLEIIDDIMKNSQTRNGKPCWYLQPDIGLSAINDAVMLENSIYFLLKKYFSGRPAYVPLLELTHDSVYKSTLGNSLEILNVGQNGKPKLELFTMDRYNSLVKYKTTYPLLQAPAAMVMHLVGKYNEGQFKQAETILNEVGQFQQIKNEYLDCFGDLAVTANLNSDIKNGKCSWLVVTALQKATPNQRKTLEEHYGRPEPESIATIHQLYEDLCLPFSYSSYEEESFNTIKAHIQKIPKSPLQDMFCKIVEQLFKREH